MNAFETARMLAERRGSSAWRKVMSIREKYVMGYQQRRFWEAVELLLDTSRYDNI